MEINTFDRKPFYLDNDTLLVKFPNAKYYKTSHAEWFAGDGVPFVNTIRGWWDQENKNIIIYWNDFAIPPISMGIISYLFEAFYEIESIGVGAIMGNKDELWKPRLVIKKNEP